MSLTFLRHSGLSGRDSVRKVSSGGKPVNSALNTGTVRVSFGSIRGDRHVPDLVVRSSAGEELERAIRAHVLQYMDYADFELHLSEGRGWIDAGTYNAGSFTIEPVSLDSSG